jgi:signal recognition particle receptor subunit beta
MSLGTGTHITLCESYACESIVRTCAQMLQSPTVSSIHWALYQPLTSRALSIAKHRPPVAFAVAGPCAISNRLPELEEIVPFINFPAREINCKLVYYGPGLGGKTANLQWIYEHTGTSQKGKMVSLATETDRTLFFDFLPLDLGTVRGFKTRFHLYTVPGQVFYEASRRLILKGADGVVFVADSQEERLDANLETLDNLREHLKDHNLDFNTIPYVLQLNKRDLPNILSVEELQKQLSVKSEPALEAVAVTGQGVFDTLKEVAKLVLAELKKNS